MLPEEHCTSRVTTGTHLGHSWDTWVTLGCLGRSAVKEQKGFLGIPGQVRSGKRQGSLLQHTDDGLRTSSEREDDPTLPCYSGSGSPANTG